MRILLSADFHGRFDWLEYLTGPSKVDLIVVAGDLLRFEPEEENAADRQALAAWLARRTPPSRRHYALCSGNHDGDLEVGPYPNIHTDGFNDYIGAKDRIFLTILPFSWEFENEKHQAAYRLLRRGAARRAETPRVPWVVVQHRPPPGLLGRSEDADYGLPKWMESLPIDFVLCGHDHVSPELNKTCVQVCGGGWALNAGQTDPTARTPDFLTLDTQSRHIFWVSRGQRTDKISASPNPDYPPSHE